MTEATNGHVDPDENKRRVIDNAMLAFRSDAAGQDQPPWEPSRCRQALADLADADVPRLVKHRRLIDGLRRCQAGNRLDLKDHASQVLFATLDQDQDEGTRSGQAEQARRRLDEIAGAPGEAWLQPQHWQLWVQSTNDIFQFTTPEQTFEACTDDQLVMKATPAGQLVPSRLLMAQFWSDLPPTSFHAFVDPQTWPQCSPFWKSMVAKRGPVPTADGYDAVLEETVDILTEELTVPLSVAFRVRPDGSRVWTRFNISRGYYNDDTKVDVDTGTVSAESVPGGPARTRVQAIKYLHWRDPDHPDPTALACAFGWSELVEEMAHACTQGARPEEGPSARPETKPPAGTGAKPSVDTAISQLVRAVTAEYQQGLTENGPYVERLIGRFTGPSWDPGWVNDLLDMGLVAARHYGHMVGDVRRFADSLRNAATDGDGHE
ncbi:MAG TPA: hypothetical protein VFO01_03525 [Trebonia sp.]|nr:hypothetical protein [Trebonia sp.]